MGSLAFYRRRYSGSTTSAIAASSSLPVASAEVRYGERVLWVADQVVCLPDSQSVSHPDVWEIEVNGSGTRVACKSPGGGCPHLPDGDRQGPGITAHYGTRMARRHPSRQLEQAVRGPWHDLGTPSARPGAPTYRGLILPTPRTVDSHGGSAEWTQSLETIVKAKGSLTERGSGTPTSSSTLNGTTSLRCDRSSRKQSGVNNATEARPTGRGGVTTPPLHHPGHPPPLPAGLRILYRGPSIIYGLCGAG